MINSKIIRLASNTKFAGLKNIFTHKSSVKNSLCGDFIKVEIIANKTKIKSMRYQTESCVICEASASLLANKIKNFNLKDLKDNYKLFNKRGEIGFSSKFKIFNQLLTGKNKSRISF